MPTYFSGGQKCKFMLELRGIVINTGGKYDRIYD